MYGEEGEEEVRMDKVQNNVVLCSNNRVANVDWTSLNGVLV